MLFQLVGIALFVTHVSYCFQWKYFEPTNMLYHVNVGGHGMNFTEAENYCKSLGAYLVTVHNEVENQFIQDLLVKDEEARAEDSWNTATEPSNFVYLRRSVFMSLKKSNNGRFVNIDGTDLSYENWRYGEPNNSGGRKDCVTLAWHRRTNTSGWNDLDCSIRLHTQVCEKPYFEMGRYRMLAAASTTSTTSSVFTNKANDLIDSSTKTTVFSTILLVIGSAAAIYLLLLLIISIRRCATPRGYARYIEQYATMKWTKDGQEKHFFGLHQVEGRDIEKEKLKKSVFSYQTLI